MIDERTGRPIGDHGTAAQALEFALNEAGAGELEFLRAWRAGEAADEWPQFYDWLRQQEAPPAEAPTIGRTELKGRMDNV